jgi:hypothetical protein
MVTELDLLKKELEELRKKQLESSEIEKIKREIAQIKFQEKQDLFRKNHPVLVNFSNKIASGTKRLFLGLGSKISKAGQNIDKNSQKDSLNNALKTLD